MYQEFIRGNKNVILVYFFVLHSTTANNFNVCQDVQQSLFSVEPVWMCQKRQRYKKIAGKAILFF